ncbi:hypothetical protein [Paenibacillus periandrae]|uniref:hypothetical protein n=1 Tax=Paenibacillus periandrae TaxID=1761741 RepID=UPI001F098442|nr:hypothetical protein [Paenibacillus periandrae]
MNTEPAYEEVKELVNTAVSPTFTKQQLHAAKKYTAQQKDMLSALLEEDQLYTEAEVDHIVNTFLLKVVE